MIIRLKVKTMATLVLLVGICLTLFLSFCNNCEGKDMSNDIKLFSESFEKREVGSIEIYYIDFNSSTVTAITEDRLVNGYHDIKIVYTDPYLGVESFIKTLNSCSYKNMDSTQNPPDLRIGFVAYGKDKKIFSLFMGNINNVAMLNGRLVKFDKNILYELIKFLPYNVYPEAKKFVTKNTVFNK